jgi:intein-encoded DNA endonuclease-like protein
MSYPKISDKKCKCCGQHIVMKRKRDEVQEFCNRKCASQFILGTKFQKSCKQCGDIFTTIPSHNYEFCSQRCANQSRSITHIRNCERCHKEFVLDNIAYERRGGGRFCSGECATRIYEFDENYFDKINTEEKAYWLGMLLSDGNLYKTQMTIKLQRRDKSHLEKFKLALNSQHPIHDGVSLEGHEFSSFFIGSKKLSKQLIKLGVVPNKTFIIEFPNLKKKFISHFIRGYFDGDGCMYNYEKHHTWSIYSASDQFLNKLLNVMEKETKLDFNKSSDEKSISLSKGEGIIALENYLYKNATVFLERKRDKFHQAISYINYS